MVSDAWDSVPKQESAEAKVAVPMRGSVANEDNGLKRRKLAAALVAFIMVSALIVIFLYAGLRGCPSRAFGTFVPVLIALAASLPLGIYLSKVAKREVPVFLHLAGLYFAVIFVAFSGFVPFYVEVFCHDNPWGAVFFGYVSLTFENWSFAVLAYMQVLRVRALSGADVGSSHQKRLAWIIRGVVLATVCRNIGLPFLNSTTWTTFFGKKDTWLNRFVELPIQDALFGLHGLEGNILRVTNTFLLVGWASYYTSISMLTYIAVKSMLRARQRLTGNDMARVYLRQILTVNMWMTLLANLVSLFTYYESLTCITQEEVLFYSSSATVNRTIIFVYRIGDAIVNGSCVLSLSGLISPSHKEAVLSYFSLASRLARLSAARARVHRELGYDLGDRIRELEEPLIASTVAYGGALDKVFSEEPEAMTELMHFDFSRLVNKVAPSKPGGPFEEDANRTIQGSNDLDKLLREAAEAQYLLKRSIAPEDVWFPFMAAATSVDSAFVSSESACLIARRSDLSSRSVAGALLAHADEAIDPGVKSTQRIQEKAMFKYRDHLGQPQFDHVRDMSRVALQFQSAEALIRALTVIWETFDIVEYENRFAKPTALGWMDVTLLVRVHLADGAFHIAEIQAQLTDFALERTRAHRYYKSIRAAIPSMGVRPEHVDVVQRIILDELEGCTTQTFGRSSAKSAGAVRNPLPFAVSDQFDSHGLCDDQRETCKNTASTQASKSSKASSSMSPDLELCAVLPGAIN